MSLSKRLEALEERIGKTGQRRVKTWDDYRRVKDELVVNILCAGHVAGNQRTSYAELLEDGIVKETPEFYRMRQERRRRDAQQRFRVHYDNWRSDVDAGRTEEAASLASREVRLMFVDWSEIDQYCSDMPEYREMMAYEANNQ